MTIDTSQCGRDHRLAKVLVVPLCGLDGRRFGKIFQLFQASYTPLTGGCDAHTCQPCAHVHPLHWWLRPRPLADLQRCQWNQESSAQARRVAWEALLLGVERVQRRVEFSSRERRVPTGWTLFHVVASLTHARTCVRTYSRIHSRGLAVAGSGVLHTHTHTHTPHTQAHALPIVLPLCFAGAGSTEVRLRLLADAPTQQWNDFQFHRRILGIVGVCTVPRPPNTANSTSTTIEVALSRVAATRLFFQLRFLGTCFPHSTSLKVARFSTRSLLRDVMLCPVANTHTHTHNTTHACKRVRAHTHNTPTRTHARVRARAPHR